MVAALQIVVFVLFVGLMIGSMAWLFIRAAQSSKRAEESAQRAANIELRAAERAQAAALSALDAAKLAQRAEGTERRSLDAEQRALAHAEHAVASADLAVQSARRTAESEQRAAEIEQHANDIRRRVAAAAPAAALTEDAVRKNPLVDSRLARIRFVDQFGSTVGDVVIDKRERRSEIRREHKGRFATFAASKQEPDGTWVYRLVR